MKERIKIDSAILSFLIVLTGFLYIFPRLYATARVWDQVLDVLGFFMIFEGIYLRMAGRGHKKLHSQKGEGLVISGPYVYIRNPMYLGTFLLGSGFILIVWPWWLLPVFGGVFFLRFRKQILIEEEYLLRQFGPDYETYCRRVPRFFPDLRQLKPGRIRKDFLWQEIWLTKEKYALLAWPAFGFFMETLQEKFVFGSWEVWSTLAELFLAMIIFELQLWVVYRNRDQA